jgi:myosin heavy subunit
MNKNFTFFAILASILIGSSFGLFSIEDSFAEDDDLSVSREDSKAYQKQLEKQEKEREKAEERKQKLEEKQEERKQKLEEKQEKEREKAEERKQKLEEKQEERKQKAEERKQKLEEKKAKLDLDRKKLEEKLSNKINKYEEKFKTAKLEDKIAKKSDEIRKKLLEKQEKLDSRTQKILDKINNGDYLGEKISTSNSFETYELTFDSVNITGIHDKTQLSTLEGFMIFNTFDKGKSNLKLELEECNIIVDDIPFNCGFGKARTTSSGDSGSKDSLVVIAFLEDDVLEEVHSTLKISLNADSPISEITDSTHVSILNPQSSFNFESSK